MFSSLENWTSVPFCSVREGVKKNDLHLKQTEKSERKTIENYSEPRILPLGPWVPDHNNLVLLGKIQKFQTCFQF